MQELLKKNENITAFTRKFIYIDLKGVDNNILSLVTLFLHLIPLFHDFFLNLSLINSCLRTFPKYG